ncbi:hypothetical protein HMP0015_3326 [Acinetobacter haemolyticus ATCC 19194]|uniref:Uncharacterized protein n=1 Tax=Acinetobacter haemolyticus ATCC 19194 TaxID=707232 RepID=D4XUD4_ACIHA|nr:hypothetical protein HMP0015_3326 [Acinetobacter haemolyticus ATCC 19194]
MTSSILNVAFYQQWILDLKCEKCIEFRLRSKVNNNIFDQKLSD